MLFNLNKLHFWATPVMSGHLPCMAMLPMSRHISTLNYLRSADTCLTRTQTVIKILVVRTCYNGQFNKCHIFGGHFNPKSLAHTLTCDRRFAQYFPCCRLVTTINIPYIERPCASCRLHRALVVELLAGAAKRK